MLDRRESHQQPESELPARDAAPPTLAEIDQHIAQSVAAEHDRMIEIMAAAIAQLQDEGMAGPPGPSGPPGEPGPPGAPGKLPIVKVWQPESVTYEAQVVSCEGATYQATRDTAQKPGGSDWICLAVPGRNAKSPRVRGTYAADAQYRALDIISLDGGSFIARKDDPGSCPGEGWQLIARQGKRGTAGEKGERGPKGDKGEPGATIKSWTIEREHYLAVPVMSDGSSGPPLELRAFFEQFQIEVF